MKRPVDFGQLSRRSPLAVGLSLLLHGALVLGIFFMFRRVPVADPVSRLIVLAQQGHPSEHPVALGPATPPSPTKAPQPDLAIEPRIIGVPGAATTTPLRGAGGIPGAGTGAGAAGGIGRLAPSYESGHLWVAPLPLTPEEIASRLEHFAAIGRLGNGDGTGTGGGDGNGAGAHGELIDSAVTAIVQSYLDSVAAEPGAESADLPSWTTEIAGLDFGIDRNYVYFAGLKIPAAVLALLPLPQDAGNYFRDRNYEYLMDVRREIYYSAWMADTRAEFKENVRKLRARKERERQMSRNQRIAPALIEDSTDASSADDGDSGQ